MVPSSRTMVTALLAVTVLTPPDCRAQVEAASTVHVRLEAGLARLNWWEESGAVYQAGAAWAGSRMSHFAIDVRVSKFVGGDGDGENAFFVGLGPEFRSRPASVVSPFLSAHVLAGFDEDGGMTAVTGGAGLALKVGRKAAIRAGTTAAPDGSWAMTAGFVFGRQ